MNLACLLATTLCLSLGVFSASALDRYNTDITISGAVSYGNSSTTTYDPYRRQIVSPEYRIPIKFVFHNNHPTISYRARVDVESVTGQLGHYDDYWGKGSFWSRISKYTGFIAPGTSAVVYDYLHMGLSFSDTAALDSDPKRDEFFLFGIDGAVAPMDADLKIRVGARIDSSNYFDPDRYDAVEIGANVRGEIGFNPSGGSLAKIKIEGDIPTVHFYAVNADVIGSRPGTVDGVEEDLAISQATCSAGTVNAQVSSVDLQIHAGLDNFSRSLDLRITGDTPSALFTRPSKMDIAKGLVETLDASGDLTQLDADDTSISVNTIDDFSYELTFYGKLPDGSPASDAHTSVLIANPDGAASMNRLHITKKFLTSQPDGNGGTTTIATKATVSKYEYDPAQERWSLTTEKTLDPDGQSPTLIPTHRTETVTTTTSVINEAGVDRNYETELRTIVDANDETISESTTTYWSSPFGRVITEQTLDPNGRNLTTTHKYYEDDQLDEYSKIKSSTTPTGNWTHYSYDEYQRVIKQVSPISDPPFPADIYDGTQDAQLQVVSTTYADFSPPGSPHETIVVTRLGVETGRRYVRKYNDGEDRQVCQTPGAAFDAVDNLVTKFREHISGPFNREPISSFFPDGTATLFEYSVNAAKTEKTTTVSTGKPSTDGLSIEKGTRTVTVTNLQGKDISTVTTDIETSLQLTKTAGTTLDPFGRPTTTTFYNASDGAIGSTTTNYDCCGVANTTDRTGVYTEYDNHDDLVSSQTSLGIKSTSTAAAAARTGGGRIETRSRVAVDNTGTPIANTSTLLAQREYDTAGYLVKEYAPPVNADTDPAPTDLTTRRATTFDEVIDATNGHRTRTITNPDGTTVISESSADGRIAKITGTGTHHSRFEYGVEIPPNTTGVPAMRFSKAILLNTDGTDSAEWEKSYTNPIGRTIRTVTSAGATSLSTYNNLGQMASQTDPDGVTLLYAYDDRGRLEITAVDLDQDGIIDYDGTDRITKTTTVATLRDGLVVLRTTTEAWTTDNDATTTAELSRFESSADSLQTWSSSEGLETHTQMVYTGSGNYTSTTTYPDNTSEQTIVLGGRLESTTTFDNDNVQVTSTSYDYDSLGRTETVTDARNGSSTIAYYADDSLKSTTTPDPGDGHGAKTTTLTYYTAGRRHTVTLPDSTVTNPKIVTYNYHLTGELLNSGGSRSYTSGYTYDYAGRMKTLGAGTGTTTWNYFADSGFLQSKIYADNQGTSYTHTLAGRPQTRTLARGLHRKTTYGNDGLPQNVNYYTDATETTADPTTTPTGYIYDRLANLKTLSDAAGQHTFTTTPTGRTELETIAGGLLAGATLDPSYDALLRRHSLSFATLGAQSLTHSYRYDKTGRYGKIAAGADPETSPSATYTYHTNSNLPNATISKTGNGAERLTLTRSFDTLNRLTTITNQGAGSTVPLNESYTFVHNPASQRQRITLADGRYWIYDYDDFGQLETATKHLPNDTAVASQTHTFNHDNIGNRNGSVGVPPASSSYTSNALNQYTQITNTGSHWITGQASVAATVKVDDATTTRPGNSSYFEYLATTDNTSGPTLAKHKITSDLGDDQDRTTRYARVPAATVAPQYDPDGNLTSDSQYTYTWDGENRLLTIESRSDLLPATYPHHKLEFAYDSVSRRIEKKVYGKIGATWQLARHKRFLYDGWNLLAEYEPKSNNTWQPTSSYLWGKDLSGTMQGAGGTSGLLHIRDHAEENGYFVAYDGKGNVRALVDETTGETAAQYAYTPFGKLAAATGEAAHLNPFRFSTRYQDTETGLYYYGYRFYNPESGRWLNRDPIGQQGGLNENAFVGNSPINNFDRLGLDIAQINLNQDPENTPTLFSSNGENYFAQPLGNGRYAAVKVTSQATVRVHVHIPDEDILKNVSEPGKVLLQSAKNVYSIEIGIIDGAKAVIETPKTIAEVMAFVYSDEYSEFVDSLINDPCFREKLFAEAQLNAKDYAKYLGTQEGGFRTYGALAFDTLSGTAALKLIKAFKALKAARKIDGNSVSNATPNVPDPIPDELAPNRVASQGNNLPAILDEPLVAGQHTLDAAVSSHPALRRVKFSARPEFDPSLDADGLAGLATRYNALDGGDIAIGSLAFRNNTQLVGTLVHEEAHLRFFMRMVSGRPNKRTSRIGWAGEEDYVRAVEARFLRMKGLTGE